MGIRPQLAAGCERPQLKWTPEKSALAKKMRAQGHTLGVISAAVGLSVQSVSREVRYGPARLQAAHERTGRVHIEIAQMVTPSTGALEERECRIAAADRRSFTQTFFGGPPPGFSALDRKRAEA